MGGGSVALALLFVHEMPFFVGRTVEFLDERSSFTQISLKFWLKTEQVLRILGSFLLFE